MTQHDGIVGTGADISGQSFCFRSEIRCLTQDESFWVREPVGWEDSNQNQFEQNVKFSLSPLIVLRQVRVVAQEVAEDLVDC